MQQQEVQIMYQSVSSHENRKHSTCFQQRGFNTGDWLQEELEGEEMGKKALRYCNCRENLSRLWLVEQKGGEGVTRPRSSNEGNPWLVCRCSTQSSGVGAYPVLMAGAGLLRATGAGAVVLLCCWGSGEWTGCWPELENWEEALLFLLLSYLQLVCPIGRTCQEANWQRSLGNEFRS